MPRRSIPFVLITVALIAAGPPPIGAQEQIASLKRIKPLEIKPTDSELRKLQKLRFNAALDEIDAATLIREEGPGSDLETLEAIFEASDRMIEAALEMYTDPNNRIKFYERQLALAKEREKIWSDRSRKDHAGDAIALQRAIGHRANVEIALLKARRTVEKTSSMKTSDTTKTETEKPSTEKSGEANPNLAQSNAAKTNMGTSSKAKTNKTKPKTTTSKPASGD